MDSISRFGSVNKYLSNYNKLKQPVDEFLTSSNHTLQRAQPFGLHTNTGEQYLKELEVLLAFLVGLNMIYVLRTKKN